eukprot:GAHX01001176.1.p1 GENE.GAHX01001176.1~~GAHX01001176.1.p1  ORF type:complete len:407 (-),score=61.81 GAHX01001176.1:165-1385(-)
MPKLSALYIELATISIFILFQISLSIYYFIYRKSFLIRHRLPFLTLLANLFILGATAIIVYSEVAVYFSLPFNCHLITVAFHLTLLSTGDFILIRGIYILAVFKSQSAGYKPAYFQTHPFLSAKIRSVVASIFVVLHCIFFTVQLIVENHIKKQNVNLGIVTERDMNCIIGQQYFFFIFYMLISLFYLFFVFKSLWRVKENLKLRVEFIIGQTALVLALVVIIPTVIYVKEKLQNDEAKARSMLYFGPNFYYVLFVYFIQVASTLGWPVYLQVTSDSKKWASSNVYDEVTMDAYLEKKENYERLMKISKKYFCSEMLFFWKGVHEFKECKDANKQEMIKERIKKDFLEQGANLEINVSMKARKQFEEKSFMGTCGDRLFDDLLREVLRMIMDNLYNIIAEEAEDSK